MNKIVHPVRVLPRISYPRTAQVGKSYVMTVDVEMGEGFDWEYQEEDYPIYCKVNSSVFQCIPTREPVVVLHRFGGNYGKATFLLKALQEASQEKIEISLSNRYGVVIQNIQLDVSTVIDKISLDEEITDADFFEDRPPRYLDNQYENLIDSNRDSSDLEISPDLIDRTERGFCSGVARIEVSATDEILEVKASELEWESEGQGAYQMGAAVLHYASIELRPRRTSYGVTVEWNVWEYPLGQLEHVSHEISGGRVLKDFDEFFIPSDEDIDDFPEPQISWEEDVSDRDKLSTALPRAVILTALYVEYLAVRTHLVDLQEETHPQGTIYERGQFTANGQTWEVGIAEIGASNLFSAIEVDRAISYFKPNIVLFVGIAGGIKDVRIGDVVAATKIYSYEPGKVGEIFAPRPAMGQSTYGIIQRAKAEAHYGNWLQRLSRNSPSAPKAFVAPIAAGDRVTASKASELFKFIRATCSDAIAVEMEGYGFLSAAFAYPEIQAIVIRGISDLIEGKNDDAPEGTEAERQEWASQNASAFAFEVLSKLQVEEAQNKEEEPAKTVIPSFFAYDDAWVGRESLIQSLSDRIRNNCRLLMLVGITGIGKTALGERLSVEVSDWFGNDWSHYRQENFDDEQQSPDFVSVAARWLEKWGELVTPDDRKAPQRLLSRLLSHMRENRYLVQMDSLENILQGNEEEGWSNFKDEWWLKFLEAYLKADFCESCIILTSQDLPGQLEEVGTRTQNFCYCQRLSGLAEPERISLFKKTNLDVSSDSEGRPLLIRIGAAYEGHPLALRVIAGEIKNRPFNGNVVAYWNKYGSEVEEAEKAIAAADSGNPVGADDKFQLDRFTKALRRNVRRRLIKTFERLEEDAKWSYIMLCETSVYRCAVPEDFWLSHLEDWDQDKAEQRAALDILRERFLVEEIIENNQVLLRQQNLVRSVSLERLSQLDE